MSDERVEISDDGDSLFVSGTNSSQYVLRAARSSARRVVVLEACEKTHFKF